MPREEVKKRFTKKGSTQTWLSQKLQVADLERASLYPFAILLSLGQWLWSQLISWYSHRHHLDHPIPGPKGPQEGKSTLFSRDFTQQCVVWPSVTPFPCHGYTWHCLDRYLHSLGWDRTVCAVRLDMTRTTSSDQAHLRLTPKVLLLTSRGLAWKGKELKPSLGKPHLPPKSSSFPWTAHTHTWHSAEHQGGAQQTITEHVLSDILGYWTSILGFTDNPFSSYRIILQVRILFKPTSNRIFYMQTVSEISDLQEFLSMEVWICKSCEFVGLHAPYLICTRNKKNLSSLCKPGWGGGIGSSTLESRKAQPEYLSHSSRQKRILEYH